jgi:hypothetical protein
MAVAAEPLLMTVAPTANSPIVMTLSRNCIGDTWLRWPGRRCALRRFSHVWSGFSAEREHFRRH